MSSSTFIVIAILTGTCTLSFKVHMKVSSFGGTNASSYVSTDAAIDISQTDVASQKVGLKDSSQASSNVESEPQPDGGRQQSSGGGQQQQSGSNGQQQQSHHIPPSQWRFPPQQQASLSTDGTAIAGKSGSQEGVKLFQLLEFPEAEINAIKGEYCPVDGKAQGYGCNLNSLHGEGNTGGCSCQWFRQCNLGYRNDLVRSGACRFPKNGKLDADLLNQCRVTLLGQCRASPSKLFLVVFAIAMAVCAIGLMVYKGFIKK